MSSSDSIAHDLAPELWTDIASLLPQCNLASLCRASSAFLRTIRGLLYREVVITKVHSETLKLLLSDQNLAKNVTTFIFHFENDGRIPSDPRKFIFHPNRVIRQACDAAMSMPNLRTLGLHLTRLTLFDDFELQQKFLDHFNTREIPLDEFQYSNNGGEFSPYEYTKFPLSRLKYIAWDDDDYDPGSLKGLPYVWDILRASQDTLEKIGLFSCYGDVRGCPLWRMKFSRLRGVSLPDLDIEKKNAGDNAEVARFLMAHPALEDLEFDRAIGMRIGNIQPNPTGPLCKESLPNVRSFTGVIHTFVQLVRYQPACLQTTLQRLEVAIDFKQSGQHILHMLDSLLDDNNITKPLFPTLKEFKLFSSGCRRVHMKDYILIVASFAELIGESLEVLHLEEDRRINLNVKYKVLGPVWEQLNKNLKVLHMQANYTNTTYPSPEDETYYEDDEYDEDMRSLPQSPVGTQDLESCVRTLASHCSKLEKVVFEDYALLFHDYYRHPGAEFRIERLQGSEGVRVHIPKDFDPEGGWTGAIVRFRRLPREIQLDMLAVPQRRPKHITRLLLTQDV